MHIVFVLLYSVCRTVSVCVRHSIFDICVTCYDFDVTERLRERERKKARGNNNDLSHVPSKRQKEIKSGTSGCGSFVFPYFQPATSIDRLRLKYSNNPLRTKNKTTTTKSI